MIEERATSTENDKYIEDPRIALVEAVSETVVETVSETVVETVSEPASQPSQPHHRHPRPAQPTAAARTCRG